jgi:hypothetical protein
MVRKKATSGAPSQLIEDLEVMVNLVSRSPPQNGGSTQINGKPANFHPSNGPHAPRSIYGIPV